MVFRVDLEKALVERHDLWLKARAGLKCKRRLFHILRHGLVSVEVLEYTEKAFGRYDDINDLQILHGCWHPDPLAGTFVFGTSRDTHVHAKRQRDTKRPVFKALHWRYLDYW